MPWNHMGWNGWHMGYVGLMGTILLLVVVVLLVRNTTGSHREDRPGDNSPEELLKRRYARGEIGKEEYDRKLADLQR